MNGFTNFHHGMMRADMLLTTILLFYIALAVVLCILEWKLAKHTVWWHGLILPVIVLLAGGIFRLLVLPLLVIYAVGWKKTQKKNELEQMKIKDL